MRKVDGEYRPLAEVDIGSSVYSAPVFADGVLYVASRTKLWAIAAPKAKHHGFRTP